MLPPSRCSSYGPRKKVGAYVGGGCRTARVLHRELRERGYSGGYDQVRRALRRRTGVDGRLRLTGPAAVVRRAPPAGLPVG
jgi:hypothetical protein